MTRRTRIFSYLTHRKTQFLVLIFILQLIMASSQFNIEEVGASPVTYPDTVWEDGVQGDNDFISHAFNLGHDSAGNNPNYPLNVSTWSPDYYNFTVYPGFYFQVNLELNPDIAYDDNNLLIDNVNDHPGFQADIDLMVIAENGSILEVSDGWGPEEAVGPIYTTASETFVINVTAVNSEFDSLAYSTTYNMTVVFDDVYELIDPNDNFGDISDPYQIGGSDDEILPGTYENLRFGIGGYSYYSGHQSYDYYLIWIYENTSVNITITSYRDWNILQPLGPEFMLYNYSQDLLLSYWDDGSSSTDTILFTINSTGWHYLRFDVSYYYSTNYYTLDITFEDSYEGTGNNDNTTAVLMTKDKYAGLVVSKDKDDWYKVPVSSQERLVIDLNWFSPPTNPVSLKLQVFENSSADSELDEARTIFNGLRFGPYRAYTDSVFLINISSDTSAPRYYNLTITIKGKDDYFEVNNNPLQATLLPATSKTYAPTEQDPFAGPISLQGDPDWYAIPLLPGDRLTVTIEFNGTLANLDLKIVDASIHVLDTSELVASDVEEVSVRVSRADVYLFVVYGVGAYSIGSVDYNMTILIDAFDDQFESNNFLAEASPIAEGLYSDLILRDGNDDWYYVYLYENDFIEINLTYFAEGLEGVTNDLDLDLLNSDESLANRSHSLLNESISYTAPESGKYYILCFIDGNSNSYNLSINIIENDDIYEDNDYIGEATRLNIIPEGEVPTETVEYELSDLQMRVMDDDWFVTNVPAGLAIIVEIGFSASENLNLYLMNLNETLFEYSNASTGDSEVVGPFAANSTYFGDFYFQVSMPSGLNTQYSIKVTIGPEEILITRESVPPHGNFTVTKPKFDFGGLIVLGAGGAIIGGGAAGGLYVANKAGYLTKASDKLKDLLGKKGGSGSGGTGDKLKKLTKKGSKPKKKPPS
ncbi:MAG: pre-peptidase C-terminal domain-containing protein [Candidatus Hodarchaeales archaeon]